MIDGSQAPHTMTTDDDFRASSPTHQDNGHVSGSLIQETAAHNIDPQELVSAQSSVQCLPLHDLADPGSEVRTNATTPAPTRSRKEGYCM
ncbi:hypothetical protein V6N11_042204 [Hibiscus sabdariffa]|uniref:Uncharacterized protein n=1 Tax=Hibiscus sabdariffa TaxID=183260 RepID=A0ABR2QWC4_9ROSI